MSFCSDCVVGVRYEGEPEGKHEEIGGVKCYIATPTCEYPANKVLLFLPDALGMSLINSRLMADDFARSGIKTVIPDYLNGDDVPEKTLSGAKFDFVPWIARHSAKETRPTLDKVIEGLKEKGVTNFAATGYCFGGRYVFDLAFDNVIDVAIVAHPSLLIFPDDLEKYLASSNAPLLINSCEMDTAFSPEAQTLADEILGNGKFAKGYKREYWKGCKHGFAVRGDMKDKYAKRGKIGAFKATVEWLYKYF